ncbi:MAG: CBS domain-containing protein [Nannocystales bacterium]
MAILVRDVMSTELVTLIAKETVSLADQLMKTIEVRHLPVLGDNGELVGIVSDRDLLSAAASCLAGLDENDARVYRRQIAIGEIMSCDIRVVTPTTPLLEAANLMHGRKIGCLPVIDGDALVGIVTESDLVGVLITALRGPPTPADAPPQLG